MEKRSKIQLLESMRDAFENSSWEEVLNTIQLLENEQEHNLSGQEKAEVLLYKGRTCRFKGNYESAYQTLEQSAKQAEMAGDIPGKIKAGIFLGDVFRCINKPELSRKALDTCIHQAEQLDGHPMLSGMAHLEKAKIEGDRKVKADLLENAVGYFAEALGNQSLSERDKRQVKRYSRTANEQRAGLYRESGDYKKAEEVFRALIDSVKNTPGLAWDLNSYKTNLANMICAEMHGKFEEGRLEEADVKKLKEAQTLSLETGKYYSSKGDKECTFSSLVLQADSKSMMGENILKEVKDIEKLRKDIQPEKHARIQNYEKVREIVTERVEKNKELIADKSKAQTR